MADDDGFITLPPGIADSATHRRERVERPRKVEREDIVFFPAAPGAPVVEPVEVTPEQVTEPVEAPGLFVAPEPAAAEPDDLDATRVSAPRHTAPGWRITVPGLGPTTVDAPLFLGRNPTAPPSHPGARVLAVDDATKSVSKTHAMLDLEAGVLRVTDLGSTNGVWVVPPGEDAIEVLPGVPVAIPAGSDLELGELVIQVEHG